MSDYRCEDCGVEAVKLWRRHPAGVKTRCYRCTGSVEGIRVDNEFNGGRVEPLIGSDGRWYHLITLNKGTPKEHHVGHKSDQIGWSVPAVPTADGAYWAYTAVPDDAARWWRQLPLQQTAPDPSSYGEG